MISVRAVGVVALTVFVAGAGRAEDDVLSYEDRRTPDGEDGDVDPGPIFSGDVRVRAREVLPKGSTYQAAPPELQHNVYFYQRTRVAWGPAGAGVLMKRSSVGPALSLDNLKEYGTMKGVVELKDVGPVVRAVAGNYTMVFGQGVLFYDGFGEFVRPMRVKDWGPRPDYTTGANDYMRGAAVRMDAGGWRGDFFASDKPLDFPLNADGSVNANLDELHEGTGDVQTVEGLRDNNTVTERLAGGRLGWGMDTVRVGVSGVGIHFNRPFNPVDTQFADARAFRGDDLRLAGADVRWKFSRWELAGEAARSKSGGAGAVGMGGSAWTGTVLWNEAPSHFWLGLFDYDPDFISPHGKGLSFGVSSGSESLPRNQRGGTVGGEWTKGIWSGRVNATLAQFPESVGNGSNTGAIGSSQGRYVLVDQRWEMGRDADFRCMYQEREEEKYEPDPHTDVRRQVAQTTRKWRGAFSWEPVRGVRWTLRHDGRQENTPALEQKAYGRMWVADVLFIPRPKTRIKARAYFFDSPEAYLTTGPEEIWDGVVYDRLAGNAGSLRGAPGTRIYAIAGQEWRGFRVWGKYEITNRPSQSEGRSEVSAPARRAWHFQLDGRWGAPGR